MAYNYFTSRTATSTSSAATASAGGGRGAGGASSAPCGSAWNRHITYIMIDFLSGRGVCTSVTDGHVTPANERHPTVILLRAPGTFGVEQPRDGQVPVGQREGVLQPRGGRALQHGRVVEELRPPAVQQRVQRQPVRPRRREVAHLHAAVALQHHHTPARYPRSIVKKQRDSLAKTLLWSDKVSIAADKSVF